MALAPVNYKDGKTVITAENLNAIQTEVINLGNSKAPVASPNFTGTPKAPTAEAGTNNTQIASTAFVKNATAGRGVAIPSGANLDDYTTPGVYHIASGAIAQTITAGGTELPYKTGNSRITVLLSANGSGIVQILHCTATTSLFIYQRAKTTGSGAWGDWKRIAMFDNLPQRNMLHNWYFAGGGSQGGAGKFPINQRLEPSYNGSGYTIDRWRINGNATSDFFLTVNSDCVLLENKNSGSYANWLNQPFETPLPAGTYTLSILTKAVSGEARLELLNESNSPVGGYATVTEGLQKYTVTITDSAAVKFAILLRPGASASIIGVKLELGNEQTLAHQENGVWVLNELPDYGEELAKCKRYYQRLTQSGGSTGYVIANVIAFSASSCNLSLRLGMRPTDNHAVSVTYSNLTDIVLAAQLINDGAELTNITYNKVTDSGDVLLTLVAYNALTAGAVYNAALKSNGAWIAFSTDL